MTDQRSMPIRLAAASLCLAAATLAGDVSYFEGFEGNEDPVRFWTCGPYGKHRVNYAGPTTERARSGRTSYKLDITFLGDGNYNYWAGPRLDIPAVRGMKLTGYIYLEKVPPNVTLGLGHSFFLPAYRLLHPTTSGRDICGPLGQLGPKSVGRWVPQEADLRLAGQSMSNSVMKELTPGVLFEKWYIHINCRQAKDARLVLYLDDISVEGSVPDHWEEMIQQKLTDWQQETEARKNSSREEFESALGTARAELEQVLPLIPTDAALRDGPWSGYAHGLLEEVRSLAHDLKKKTAAGQEKLPASRIRVANQSLEFVRNVRDAGIRPLKHAVSNLRELARRKEPYLFFIRDNPITNYRVIPTARIIDGEIGNEIRAFASPGEYEPATFMLLPSRETTVTFDRSDLRSEAGLLRSEVIDLRVVKVWYQAGINIGEVSQRLLTPELLLKDQGLVEVDHRKKANVVRNMDAPRDAKELQPVHIEALEPRQFWLTIHVPEDAAPGEYTGKIVVHAAGLGDRELTVKLLILPIKLEEPHLEYSLYYRGCLRAGSPPFVSSEHKTAQQLEAEFRNMKAHGITNPNVYQRFTQPYLDQYLDARARAGLRMDSLYYLGVGTGSASNDAQIAKRLALIERTLAYFRSKGAGEVYFHGSDEAHGEALKRQRKMWQAVHEAGGKVFVACSTGFFGLVGDLLDCPVVSRQSPADVPRVHAHGHKMHNYSNPPGAIEQPCTYRYHVGLWLARSGMDGLQTYAYQHGEGPGKMMGHIWDDFDNKIYRSIAFAYPTADGVVDTLQWEGLREGIDDVRYLATLRKAIATARTSPRPATVKLTRQAEAWLRDLDIEGDLQAVRRRMAEWITALSGERQ